MSPEPLSPPVLGPTKGALRYTKFVIPVATTADGAAVTWVVEPLDHSGSRHLQVLKAGAARWDMDGGLSQFLVITLSGAYAIS